jgi:hypothetical protein
MVVVDCCLRNVWKFCGSDRCCGKTGYCGCCTCGDDAGVDVCGHTHTQSPLLGALSVIIIEVNSFSQDNPPQEGNLSLE